MGRAKIAWQHAIRKVQQEGYCRVCGSRDVLDPAHVINRKECIRPDPYTVDPDEIVTLCRKCHTDYDNGALDIRPHLNDAEFRCAIAMVGLGNPKHNNPRLDDEAWSVWITERTDHLLGGTAKETT